MCSFGEIVVFIEGFFRISFEETRTGDRSLGRFSFEIEVSNFSVFGLGIWEGFNSEIEFSRKFWESFASFS